MANWRGFQKERPKMDKRKQRDERKEIARRRKQETIGMPRKEQVAISRLRTGFTRATHGPKMEGVVNAPSATPIYPSTTYCGNAKKLRTRERTWTWERNNGSTGKKYGKDNWLRKRMEKTTEKYQRS
jgi:hypothetical protein